MRGRVEVDLSNRSAAIIVGERCEALYSGVTRRNVLEVIGADGWVVASDREWQLTSPPDGFWRGVRLDVDRGQLTTVE